MSSPNVSRLAFRYERTWAKWSDAGPSVALSSTRSLSSTIRSMRASPIGVPLYNTATPTCRANAIPK